MDPWLLLYRRPFEILARDGDTDALIQLFIMIIIMAFAIIGNILKARSEAAHRKVKRQPQPPVRRPKEPSQPPPSNLPVTMETPVQRREDIPYASVRLRDIQKHPYPSRRRQQILPKPVIASQTAETVATEAMEMQLEIPELQEKTISQPKPTVTKEIKIPLFRFPPDSLRQAVIFHEILGKPLSLRDVDDRPF